MDMKKTLITTITLIALVGCGDITAPSQDIEKLQKHYSTVYKVGDSRHICWDSTGVYDIRMTNDGKIFSKIKIK
jgi:hypothetical protein